MASRKNQKPKLSRIEKEALKEIQKACGIKIYFSRQELQKALREFKK